MSESKGKSAELKGKYAWSVTVGTKGQIVIPKEARELFHIAPGDSLLILADETRGIAIPPKDTFNELAAKIFGHGTGEAGES